MMRHSRILLGYFLITLLGGALLAPPTYKIVQQCLHHGYLLQLAPFGLGRYVSRLVLLLAIVLLPVVQQALCLPTWKEIGLTGKAFFSKQLPTGFVLAASSTWLFAVVAVYAGVLQPHQPVYFYDGLLAFGLAMSVAWVEEILFRGIIFAGLRRDYPSWLAAIMVSVVFALLHFVRIDSSIKPATAITFTSGIMLLPQLIVWPVPLQPIANGLLMLLVMSLLLCHTVVRRASLALAIGLHAGWVFALKLIAVGFSWSPGGWWLSSLDGRGGWGPLCLMLATWLWLWPRSEALPS